MIDESNNGESNGVPPKKRKPGTENIIGKGFDKNPQNINRKGVPKRVLDLKASLDRVLGEERDGETALDIILYALRRKAARGDEKAAKILLDRRFGQAKQYVENTIVPASEPITGFEIITVNETKALPQPETNGSDTRSNSKKRS